MESFDTRLKIFDLVILSSLLFLLIVPISLFFGLLITNKVLDNDWLISITFLPIIIISIFIIVHDISKSPYSLNLMHMLFIFSFLGLAPFIQYLTESLPFNNFDLITDTDILLANILIYIWIIFYLLGYYMKTFIFCKDNFFYKLLNHPVSWDSLKLSFFISIITFLYLYKLGIFLKWTRLSYDSIVYSFSTSKALVIAIFLRGIPTITLGGYILMLKRMKRKMKLGVLVVIILIILNTLFNSPLAAPRYWTATILIGFVIILLGKKFKTGTFLTFSIIIGLLVVIPLLNVGRYYPLSKVSTAIKFVSPIDSLKSGDFDAYANIIHTVHYIQANGITWGRQLLGCLLFFIPRAIWPNKPIGSGHVVARAFNFPNFNISSPLQAEALINFGVIGIPIFAMIFGRILKIVDDCYKREEAKKIRATSNNLKFIDIIYPFWMGFAFFMSRGDLMSSLAYTVGFTLAGLFLVIGVKRNIKL